MNQQQRSSTKKKRKVMVEGMPVLRRFVAGVDIGSREHWVCGPVGDDGRREVRSFDTTTAGLEALVEWLKARQVVSVAMESTSVYWIPLYELLEAHGIEAVLVNAREVRHVPGRPKTDVRDCEWLQRLHSIGFLRGSFRPSDCIVRLRALHRHQTNLVDQRTKYVQWMQKALDQMNVQVHHAVTDLTGTTGMAIIRAIAAGERNPMRLAAFRDPRCQKSEAQIAEHLRGTWRDEHLRCLESSLRLYESLQTEIDDIEQHLTRALADLQPPERKDLDAPRHPKPSKEKEIRNRGHKEFRNMFWRLVGVDLFRIDGINAGAVRVVLTEVGFDLTKFAREKAFVSWLHLCPPTAISGGKPLKKRHANLGANRVANVLRMAAATLQRSKTALGAQFRRISRIKGFKVAVFAMARRLAQLIYRMLKYGQDYVDIGAERYEALTNLRRLAGLKQAAQSLGYDLVPTGTTAQ
jgi:transposase